MRGGSIRRSVRGVRQPSGGSRNKQDSVNTASWSQGKRVALEATCHGCCKRDINLKFMGDSSEGSRGPETADSRQNTEARQDLPSLTADPDFKRKSVRGGAATVVGQGVNMALQIGTTLILARLLSPTDYGLQAMVLTLTNFFSLFKDAGLSVATVQRETLTHEQISTLFWVN